MTCFSTLSFGLAFLCGSFVSSFAETFPSSCRDLPDGTHSLKLMEGDLEDAPIVDLECSNGYTILDVSKDSNLESYFESFMNFHHSAAGPTNAYQVNWEGWYLADDGNTNYLISPDCSVCEEDATQQLHGTKTVYMMTGTLFGCFWNLKGEHNFDMDFDSYECYYSSGDVNAVGEAIRHVLDETATEDDWDSSGVCAVSVRESNKVLPSVMAHDACTVDKVGMRDYFSGEDLYDVSETYHLKPSIGTNGQFCVCVQPSNTEYYEVAMEEVEKLKKESEIKAQAKIEAKKVTFQMSQNTEYNEEKDTYYLYQKDFESGTYRIQESGTYKIMENIEFDFNADYDSPHSEDSWWPRSEQSELYPGAGNYFDTYFLGFFAGITIEADDVTLDLNGFELKMSEVFYHQQRWFTVISLTSQYFLPGQGIGFFGSNPHFSENVIIKNGILGLSSHHGIHGHFNKNVLIENVWVKDFETHGIQFNGFDGIVINNCEIGPSSTRSPFKGEYGHVRTLLKRFQAAADDFPDTELKFYGRDEAVTMQDIVDELTIQLDMAYQYVVNGETYDDDNESWQSAKNLFLDNTNLPNGAAMYGIFLNTYGASVLTYNLATFFYSNDATVTNTKIHGLEHAMNEYTRIAYPGSGNLFMNPLHAPFDAEQILGDLWELNVAHPRYVGSIITDACVALEKLENNNWSLLQAQLMIDDNFLDWAFAKDDTDPAIENMNTMVIGCNTDVMIHSGKGINGLRIDGVKNVQLENIEIYDISEQTPLGNEVCGEYDNFDGSTLGFGGGHFRQTLPMQTGFSGTMVQAININAASDVTIKDISMYNLESSNGPVFGISLWPATSVKFEGDIKATLFNAGKELETGTYTYSSRPNRAPEVCAIRLYESYTTNDVEYIGYVNEDDVSSYDLSCMKGHVSCFAEKGTFSNYGTYVNDDGSNDCNYESGESKSLNKWKTEEMKSGKMIGFHSEEKHHNVNNVRENNTYSIGNNTLLIAAIAILVFGAIFMGLKMKGKNEKKLIESVNNVNENVKESLITGKRGYGSF